LAVNCYPQGVVRRATIDDLETLVAGNIAMAKETEDVDLDPQVVEPGVRAALLDPKLGAYWVLEEQGEVLAQLMITYEWSDWRNRIVWWIQSVYVAPKARGRGLYRALYEAVLEQAQEAGAAGLRLYVDTTNTSAQAVYCRLGMNGDHYRVFEKMFS